MPHFRLLEATRPMTGQPSCNIFNFASGLLCILRTKQACAVTIAASLEISLSDMMRSINGFMAAPSERWHCGGRSSAPFLEELVADLLAGQRLLAPLDCDPDHIRTLVRTPHHLWPLFIGMGTATIASEGGPQPQIQVSQARPKSWRAKTLARAPERKMEGTFQMGTQDPHYIMRKA